MNKFLPFSMVLTAALTFTGCKRPVLGNIATEIEGQWAAVSGTSNGEPAPAGYLDRMTFEFKGGKFLVNGGAPGSGYMIDATRDPAWIDIDNSLKQVGIVKIIDGQLHLCTGTRGDRPTDFKTQPHTDQTYLVLKAKK
jgi:uncharacterized protein (TIGR03067 family)